MGDESETMGPVDYLVVEFPEARITGEPLSHLIDLSERGVVRVLDLLFLEKAQDGAVRTVEVSDLDGDGQLDLLSFGGASSGLIGSDDVHQAGSALEPGTAAAVLIYENLWARPLAGSLRSSGAQLVASGRIPADVLLEAVEAMDAASAGV